MATVSGVWKFNSTIKAVPFNKYGMGANYENRQYILTEHGANIVPSTAAEGIVVYRLSLANTFGDWYVDGFNPTSFYEEVILEVDYDSQRMGLNVDSSLLASLTVDFGIESQSVSEDFYNWLIENASKATTITYNGAIIANLFGGQYATLKCDGMKMESDVVVNVAKVASGGGSDEVIPEGYIKPSGTLEVTENGTYNVIYYESVDVRISAPTVEEYDGEMTIE